MRVIFMGTPDFAVGTLEAIIKAGYEVALVVTQPDKPKGRSGALSFPPVKECALAHELPVFQPRKVREEENIEYLKTFEPDIIVVAAFGQILPKAILDMPKYGCINVHASLLPKYRGAAPIQWSVINGDEVTGVTIQRMDIGIDTGDIIAKEELPIAEDETGGSLFDKLAVLGAKLCVETMERIEKGEAEYIPQNHEEATHVGMIEKEFGNIDWNKSAVEIERLIRGLNPWPSAFTKLEGKTFKIWKAKVVSQSTEYEPGCIIHVTKTSMEVQTGKGVLSLLEVQLEGKKRMEIDAFLRGFQVLPGTFLSR
ncbi:MAG: methionyl-tRNA formyltransferase [Lachnospiraceae bacterium]|nr:methionyl-tRNA formyltransferase [Lachnospiraceae bacterium]